MPTANQAIEAMTRLDFHLSRDALLYSYWAREINDDKRLVMHALQVLAGIERRAEQMRLADQLTQCADDEGVDGL